MRSLLRKWAYDQYDNPKNTRSWSQATESMEQAYFRWSCTIIKMARMAASIEKMGQVNLHTRVQIYERYLSYQYGVHCGA
jgi:hypothetical protein